MCNKNYIILLIIILFCSCKSLKQSDFQVKGTTDLKLPFLSVEVDIQTLNYIITKDNPVTTIDVPNPKLDPKIIIDGQDERYYRTNDSRVTDALKLYVIFVNNTLCNQLSKEKNGKIKLEVISYKERKNGFFTFFSIWTFCTINFLGFPLREISTELELGLTIKDVNQKIIKTYQAKGKGFEFTAMYWGYGEDTRRASSIKAFKMAFIDIKKQIDNDNIELTEKLN